jgi:rhodanese-related sulfurtransferase
MNLTPQDSLARKAAPVGAKEPEELAGIVARFARSAGWLHKVRLRAEGRWFERLSHGPDYDLWVISWLPGQSTGFHDHGVSSGALVVATGLLEEHRPGEPIRALNPDEPIAFGADYAHDVRNNSVAPAISIHAYSPPLTEMNAYELEDSRLIPRPTVSATVAVADPQSGVARPRGIEQVLEEARARLQRLSPEEAYAAVTHAGAILVDIRPEGQRAVEGSIPGALVVERNVLEWRFDPASSARLPMATHHNLEVIVLCSEGYTSSLAAAALQDLGLYRATDVVGGFQAWRAQNLPTVLQERLS